MSGKVENMLGKEEKILKMAAAVEAGRTENAHERSENVPEKGENVHDKNRKSTEQIDANSSTIIDTNSAPNSGQGDMKNVATKKSDHTTNTDCEIEILNEIAPSNKTVIPPDTGKQGDCITDFEGGDIADHSMEGEPGEGEEDEGEEEDVEVIRAHHDAYISALMPDDEPSARCCRKCRNRCRECWRSCVSCTKTVSFNICFLPLMALFCCCGPPGWFMIWLLIKMREEQLAADREKGYQCTACECCL